jgi:hypothetical protein
MSRSIIHLMLFALVTGWVVGTPRSVRAQDNLVENGEFDNDLENWGIYGGAGFTVDAVQSGALSGFNACLIDVTNAGAGDSIGIAQGPLQFAQGETYEIGLTAKASQDREMVILIQLYDPAGPTWTDLFVDRVALTSEAQTFTLEYTHSRESAADHPDWEIDIYYMLKGQYWAMTGSDLNARVWLDRLYIGQPPAPQTRTRAVAPDPADGAAIETPQYALQWVPGEFAISHEVYLGESFEDVNEGNVEAVTTTMTMLVAGAPGGVYPDGLVPGTTYYWRVDEVNDTHPESPWKGNVWSFLVRPTSAYQPTPIDGAQLVHLDPDLGWEKGLNALFHMVYTGTNREEVEATASGGWMQLAPPYDPGTMEPNTTYYWRVDTFNGTQWFQGDVWSFTTVPEVAVTDPNLAGWWTLDEGSGTTAVDWSGHGNHGVLIGGPSWVDGYYGGALKIGADGQYVDCGQATDRNIQNDFTLAAWVKLAPGNAGVYGGIAGQLTNPGSYMGFALVRHSSNVFRLWVGDGQTTLNGVASSDAVYTDTEWHHIVGVRNGQTNALYVDATRQAETTDTGFAASPEFFHIGRQYSHLDGRYFRGLIDDVRLYDMALSDEQIAETMRGDPLRASQPSPAPLAVVDVRDATALSWSAGETAASHNVYVGTDRDAVAAADKDAVEFQVNQFTTSLPLAGLVELGGGDYVWRIDEVESDGTIHTGYVWRFTVPDYLIIDDFESYTNDSPNRLFQTWVDGLGYSKDEHFPDGHPGNGTGAAVGHDIWNPDSPHFEGTIGEIEVVHGGGQSMPLSYDNTNAPWHSEAQRTWDMPQDWTAHGVETLTLHVRGADDNAPAQLYIALEDSSAGTAVVANADAAVTTTMQWTAVTIALEQFAAAGLNVAGITKMSIGIGDRNGTTPGGTGVLYIDDVRLTKTLAE